MLLCFVKTLLQHKRLDDDDNAGLFFERSKAGTKKIQSKRHEQKLCCNIHNFYYYDVMYNDATTATKKVDLFYHPF